MTSTVTVKFAIWFWSEIDGNGNNEAEPSRERSRGNREHFWKKAWNIRKGRVPDICSRRSLVLISLKFHWHSVALNLTFFRVKRPSWDITYVTDITVIWVHFCESLITMLVKIAYKIERSLWRSLKSNKMALAKPDLKKYVTNILIKP